MRKIINVKKSGAYAKAINYAMGLVIAAILLAVVFVIFFRSSGKLCVGGTRLFKITSGSMEPVCRVGDYVVVRRETPENLKSGDIIAFVSESGDTRGQVIIHRIVAAAENGAFVTRGEANPADDYSNVDGDNIIGVVTTRIAFLKYIDRLFSRAWVFIILIITPLTLMIANETAWVIKKSNRHRFVTAVIIKYGLDTKDRQLYELAELYGEDAVRSIAEKQQKSITIVSGSSEQ